MSTIRCVFIGETNVGKTTLLNIAGNTDRRIKPTIGVDNVLFDYNNRYYQCWDTSGAPQFEAVVNLFVIKSSLIVYVYNTNRKETFKPDNIPEDALIVANIRSGAQPISNAHIPVSIHDRNSINRLLDILADKYTEQEPVVTITNSRECCTCF